MEFLKSVMELSELLETFLVSLGIEIELLKKEIKNDIESDTLKSTFNKFVNVSDVYQTLFRHIQYLIHDKITHLEFGLFLSKIKDQPDLDEEVLAMIQKILFQDETLIDCVHDEEDYDSIKQKLGDAINALKEYKKTISSSDLGLLEKVDRDLSCLQKLEEKLDILTLLDQSDIEKLKKISDENYCIEVCNPIMEILELFKELRELELEKSLRDHPSSDNDSLEFPVSNFSKTNSSEELTFEDELAQAIRLSTLPLHSNTELTTTTTTSSSLSDNNNNNNNNNNNDSTRPHKVQRNNYNSSVVTSAFFPSANSKNPNTASKGTGIYAELLRLQNEDVFIPFEEDEEKSRSNSAYF